MDTLSKKYTSKFFATEDDYLAMKKHWSKLVNSDAKYGLTATHHLLYLILMGKNWQKAFTLPTSKNKIENGYKPKILSSLRQIRYTFMENKILEPFYDAETDTAVSHEALEEVRKLIPNLDYEFTVINNKYTIAPYKE